MKKLLSCITAIIMSGTICSTPTLAAKTQTIDLSGWILEGGAQIKDNKIHLPKGQESRAYKEIEVSTPYHNISASVYTESANGISYLYGEGDGFTKAKTALTVCTGNTAKTVTVKSQGTITDKITAGIYSDGTNEIYASDFCITPVENPYEFLQGGDITMIRYVIDNGGNYYDENGNLLYNTTDNIEDKIQGVINYLAKRGMNFCRIRLTNNPGEPGELINPDNTSDTSRFCLPKGYQDEYDCLKLSQYAHNAGMKIQFTFNLSDYWSNAEQQIIPIDWQEKIKGKTDKSEIVTILSQCVSDYVTDILTKLANMGIYPEYVSLGNEITGGILFPYAYSYDVTGENVKMPKGNEDWGAITKILNAGYDAIKAVSKDSQVVIHLNDATYSFKENGPDVDWAGVAWWFKDYKNAGGKWDVTGISYYPSWSTVTVDDCASYCDYLEKQFGKKVLIMESGYEFNSTRKDGHKGQLQYNAPEYETLFPRTQSGQKGFVAELLSKLKNTDSAIGSLYWDPMMIHVEDKDGKNITGWAHTHGTNEPQVNVVENTTLFDFDGKAVTALEAYEYNTYSKPQELFIFAGYDKDGVLKDVKTCKTENEFNPDSMPGLEIKKFHWQSMDDIKPISEVEAVN